MIIGNGVIGYEFFLCKLVGSVELKFGWVVRLD